MGTRKLTALALGATLLLAAGSALSDIRTISSRGEVYVPLNNIAPYYGMQISQTGKDRIQLKNKWHTLEFETDSRRCWINGALVWLNNPVRKIGWQWALKDPDFAKTVEPSVRPYAFLKNAGSRVVVLDPGHGGSDTGATSPRKIHEKLLTKNIANRVRNLLQARGITVYLTREDDRNLSLTERGKIAARRNADVFVSLHADSAGTTAEGAGTFILALPQHYSTHSYGKGTPSATSHPGNKFDLANQALGTRIQQYLVKSTSQNDRGVKRARFQVLREAPCPAALVEMAFITNPKEERFVLSKSGQDKIARGIADGIAAYLHDISRAKK
ncbi:MAG: N-acetylmuramoyl-L-alanine amidase [Kiritimatiellales bacterium]|nr:N-acetylmuramoyl-L-alanine amidase [Kiritimatiellota bacterium]MBL7012010.1 N-acetylmuramoyl-L-alanine amidase [Kiritimatiellales bacterium]